MKKYNFTKSETIIVSKVLENLTNKQIANQLFVTEKTICFHLGNVYKKTKCKNRIELKKLFRYLLIA